MILGGQGELLEVVRATHPVGCLTDLLNRGQKEPDQNCNDGNDNEELNERKRRASGEVSHTRSPINEDVRPTRMEWSTDCQYWPSGAIDNRGHLQVKSGH